MQRKSKSVRHIVARQFAGANVFAPGGIVVAAVFALSLIASITLKLSFGGPLLFIIFGLFMLTLIATAIVYGIVRRRPLLARNEIQQFIRSRETAIEIYEKGAAQLLRRKAELEGAWEVMFSDIWDAGMAREKTAMLARLDEVICEVRGFESRMSREDKLRNQTFLIKTLALIRDAEDRRAELAASPSIELPESVLEEMRQKAKPHLEIAHGALQSGFDTITGYIREEQAQLDEARALL